MSKCKFRKIFDCYVSHGHSQKILGVRSYSIFEIDHLLRLMLHLILFPSDGSYQRVEKKYLIPERRKNRRKGSE